MVEGIILQEIVLWSWSGPPYFRKLWFARGRNRHVNGSYGLHMTENCLSLVRMGCAKTYVSFLRGERDLVTYILDMVPIVNYNFVLPEDLWPTYWTPTYWTWYRSWTTILYYRKTYVTYILDIYILDKLMIVNYNFVLPEDLCDVLTGHGSDRVLHFL